MGRRPAQTFIVLVLQAGVGYLWIRSALSHLGNPYFFLGTIYNYQLVPADVGPCLAEILPAVQLVLGVALLTGLHRRAAFLVSAYLLSGFVLVQSLSLWRGLDISCGCFGAASSLKIGPVTLAVAFVGMIMAIAGFELTRPPLPQVAEPVQQPIAEP